MRERSFLIALPGIKNGRNSMKIKRPAATLPTVTCCI